MVRWGTTTGGSRQRRAATQAALYWARKNRIERQGGGSTPAPDPTQAAVAALFANPTQRGVWYDASDLSTQLRDGLGGMVTEVGQKVAMVLDKSRGLRRGPELVANPSLTVNTNWTVTDDTDGRSATFGPTGVKFISPTPGMMVSQTLAAFTSIAYEVTVVCSEWVSGAVKIADSSLGFLNVNGVGTYRAIMRSPTATIAAATSSVNLTIQSLSIKVIYGRHIWQEFPDCQPLLQQDGGGKLYWAFDGIDDFFRTEVIDLTNTDKLTVWAGIRKGSDANVALPLEFSANLYQNQGSFYVAAPISADGDNVAFAGRGTQDPAAPIATGLVAPVSVQLTGELDIAAPYSRLRANGIVTQEVTGSLGTGNFGAYPLYIGRRAGQSNAFTGSIYGIILRGLASTEDELKAGEMYITERMGEDDVVPVDKMALRTEDGTPIVAEDGTPLVP